MTHLDLYNIINLCYDIIYSEEYSNEQKEEMLNMRLGRLVYAMHELGLLASPGITEYKDYQFIYQYYKKLELKNGDA